MNKSNLKVNLSLIMQIIKNENATRDFLFKITNIFKLYTKITNISKKIIKLIKFQIKKNYVAMAVATLDGACTKKLYIGATKHSACMYMMPLEVAHPMMPLEVAHASILLEHVLEAAVGIVFF